MNKEFKLTNEETSSVCRSLELMIHSGISFSDALTLLLQEETDPTLREVFSAMSEKTAMGDSLANAAIEAGCFPDYMCTLLKVGEQTGNSEKALGSLAAHYERRESVNRHLRSALLYPCVLMLIMLAVIIILLVYVLPVFNEVYAQLGSSLTGIAGGFLALGKALKSIMPVLLAIVGVFAVFVLLFSVSTKFREKVFAGFRKNRGDKGISANFNNARFAEAIAMGLAGGLNTEDAVKLSAEVLEGIPSAQTNCEECGKLLAEGKSLAAALEQTGLIPRSKSRLLEIAERSGLADNVMEQIADSLNDEAEADLEQKLSKLEPALVLVCSILVGLILVSVMLPLMNIMAVIG